MRRVVLSMAAAAALIALPALAQNQGTTSGSSGTDTTMGTDNNTTTGATYDNTANTGSTYDSNAGTTTTTTVTGTSTAKSGDKGITAGPTTTVNGVPVQEKRTNPMVPTHTPDSGLTATGNIVSWNHSELVLRTSTGITHFKMVPDTVGYNGEGSFQEGQLASVDFTRNEQGVLIAKQVRLGQAVTTAQVTTTTTTTPSTPPATTTYDTTTATPPAPEPVPAPAPETTASTTTYDTTTPATTDTTASTAGTTTDNTTSTRMPATASDSPLVALLGLMALGAAAGLRRL